MPLVALITSGGVLERKKNEIGTFVRFPLYRTTKDYCININIGKPFSATRRRQAELVKYDIGQKIQRKKIIILESNLLV